MHKKIDYNEFLKQVSQSLRSARRKSGYTQAELGKFSMKTQSTIAKMESNPATDIPLRVLFEVSTVLSTPLWQLIKDAEVGTEPKLTSSEEEVVSLINRIHQLPPYKRPWIEQILDLILTPPHPPKRNI